MNPTNRRRVAITAALAAFGLGSFVATQDASAQRRPRADSDYDNDGVNNRRDRDDDNDGRIDRRDRDDDNDGINDKRDRDDDNDGVRDRADNDPYMGHGPRPGTATHTWRFSYRPMRYDDRHYDDLDAYDLGYRFDADDFYTHLGSDYRRFDRNRDGRLQLGERQAFWIHMARMGMFGPMSPAQAREMGSLAAIMDTNGNGQLTRYELRRLTRFIKARQLFIAFDRNRDGRLHRRETRGYFTREFSALDLNGDRTLTMMELRRSLMAGPRRTYWGYR